MLFGVSARKTFAAFAIGADAAAVPPSFLFRLPFFSERKAGKRKPIAGRIFLSASALPTCCTKRTVQMRTVRFLVPYRTCGKASFLRLIIYPAVSFVSFLQEKKSFPLEEKKSFPPLVSPSHGAGVTAGAGLIVGSSCARYASTISSTDSSFRMMEISMRRLRVRPASVAFVSTGRVAP